MNFNVDLNCSCEVASRVGYLIGVDLDDVLRNGVPLFDNEWVAAYTKLDTYRQARIARNLCIIRNRLMNFVVNPNDKKMSQALVELESLGVDCKTLKKGNVWGRLSAISSILKPAIKDCKDIFPMWADFKYISDLFRTPCSAESLAKEYNKYEDARSFYPYGVYIYWNPVDMGNILCDDKTLFSALYAQHKDTTHEAINVTKGGTSPENSIQSFINESYSVVMVVDCENSDAYKMLSTLKTMGNTSKVSKIILVGDSKSNSFWGIIEKCTSIPVESFLIERIKNGKSLVDIALSTVVCREHYQNKVNSFILFSSDSDFWGLFTSLPDVKFMFMLEKEKVARGYKAVLGSSKVNHFYMGNPDPSVVVCAELNKLLSKSLSNVNMVSLLGKAAKSAHIAIPQGDCKAILDEYIKDARLSIDQDGMVSVNSISNR